MPRLTSITLHNGLRVVVQPQPHLQGVALSALVRVGSGDEACDQAGLAHLVEHMLFRGSRRHRTAKSLMEPFEDAGGMLEAETWRDHTHFSALVHHEQAQPAIAALGDMLSCPRFLGLTAERRLVEAEIEGEMDEQGEEATLHTLSRRAVWGEDHPMARRITGSIEGVRGYDRAALRAFHQEHYVGRRMVISLCGAISPSDAVAWVSQAFGHLPRGHVAPALPRADFAPQQPVTWLSAAGPQVTMQLTFEAAPLHHATQAAEELIGMLLSDGMLSRLQEALSDRSGLVYTYDAGFDVYRGFGTYDLEIQVAPHRAVQALERAMSVFRALAERGPDPAELARAKRRAQLAASLDRDRPSESAYDAGLATLFDEAAHEAAERFAAVTASDVRHAARALFVERGRHLLVMGPSSKRLRALLARAFEAPAGVSHASLDGARSALPRRASAAKRLPPSRR